MKELWLRMVGDKEPMALGPVFSAHVDGDHLEIKFDRHGPCTYFNLDCVAYWSWTGRFIA